MTVRTSRTSVTFCRPFLLSGIDELQPAGTYALETEEELIEGLSFPAWRRTGTVIILGSQGGLTQFVGIDPAALEAAQANDAPILPEPAMETTLDDLLSDEVLLQTLRSANLTPHAFKRQLSDLAARVRQRRRGRRRSTGRKVQL
jgi:hypothetical protein